MARRPLGEGPLTANLHVRLTPELKAIAEGLARDDRRSVSDYVRGLIERAADEAITTIA